MKRITDIIFENYKNYIDNHPDMKTPSYAVEMLTNDNKYNHYISSLLKNISEEDQQIARQTCDRQRQLLLEDMSNISQSNGAIGYAVSYFPILCDIYIDDILGKAITHYPYNKPIITIPYMSLQAKVENSDGTEKTWKFPRAQHMIRSSPETLSLMPKTHNNLFQLSKGYPNKINKELSSINKRYFILEEIYIKFLNDKNEEDYIVEQISLRPDARGQLSKEIEILHDDDVLNCSLIGNINWDTGVIQYNIILENGKDNYKYVCEYVISNVVFSPKRGDIGRVKISIKNEGWDVNIDVQEDFEYELDVETIQEYEDIYKVDLIKTMSLAIKNQTLLNRDHDISYLLKSNESKMKSFRNYEYIDLQIYRDTSGWLSPGFISTFFQLIVPRISIVNKYIYQNYRASPQYLLTGIKTAALLENLQEFAITMPTQRNGVVGFDNVYGMTVHQKSFASQIVLTSPAIDDNKIYHIYKPENKEDLRYTTLVNFIYKPLYIVEEVTNSIKRTFVRSRTAMELTSPEATGVTIIDGLKDLLTVWGNEKYISKV